MTHHNQHDNHSGEHHIVPFSVYYWVWLGLIVGTVLTVATSYIDFGGGNIYVAMFIATSKAMLVILYFMGLKYDGYENTVTFFSSFFFLLILVLFTAGDIFTRPFVRPVHVDEGLDTTQGSESVDMNSLLSPTPELVGRGKQLFEQQCSTCHGANGKGDGPAAAALNPKPRNFTVAEGWKNGRTLEKVFGTLTKGLPGTPMPSFSALSVMDRMALAHFVRSLTPNAPKDSSEEIAALKKSGASAEPKLPIRVGMELVANADQPVRAGMPLNAVSHPTRGDGQALYQRFCMTCHAEDGKGGVVVEAFGGEPKLQYTTAPFTHSNAMGSLSQFQSVVEEGIPGRGMPGFAQFTGDQWQSLFQYVKSLR